MARKTDSPSSYYAWIHGDPRKVIYPTDSHGQFCGQKNTPNANKAILFYFNMLKCANPAVLINLQCPTTQWSGNNHGGSAFYPSAALHCWCTSVHSPMIAIYGKNFCTSSKDAFFLLMRNVIRVAVLDKVTDFLLFFGKLLITGGVAPLRFPLERDPPDVC
ncbi:hypothetical protein Q5P01_016123 [Channa striata]|uniref:Choline transporter-like protein n=1 Tax=Channa striata TaxID=64152 RepID=A0AA88MEP7_CHASR|nr:hypothetical protein Q5P01_016123 [Channa striata]